VEHALPACSLGPVFLEPAQWAVLYSTVQYLAGVQGRLTMSLGSLVMGLLQRSMVRALYLVALPHHDSHHSHSWGSEKMGTCCCT